MSSKKKLIISLLVVAFVILSIVATIVIIFAATQQTIKTTLSISYKAQDIDGTASATYTIGGVTEKLTAMKGENVIGDKLVFKAADKEDVGNLMFPEDALALTAQNDNVVIQYTYSNTGSKHYIASMDFAANITANNMKVEYSIDGVSYSENRYAVVVPAKTSNRSYWIKISINNKAAAASFTGDFDWLLAGCDTQNDDYLSLSSVEFKSTGTAGEYAVAFNGNGTYLPQLIFPSEVNGDPVTTIAQNTSLTDTQKAQVTSAYIPDSVTTIGESAFEGFTNLQTVTLQQNESAGASAQASSGLTTIGANAFKNCSKLNNLVIPSTVKTCDGTALTGCAGLKKITVETNRSFAAIKALSKTYTGIKLIIGNSVTSIESSAFNNCSGLKSVVIPDSVTSIGYNAFRDCTGLTSVVIGNGITNIGDCVFLGCTGLTSIVIPDSVTSIGNATFSYCSGLTSVVIPENVTSMGEYAFSECTGLTSVIFENKTGWNAGNNTIDESELTDSSNAAELLTDVAKYCYAIWTRTEVAN